MKGHRIGAGIERVRCRLSGASTSPPLAALPVALRPLSHLLSIAPAVMSFAATYCFVLTLLCLRWESFALSVSRRSCLLTAFLVSLTHTLTDTLFHSNCCQRKATQAATLLRRHFGHFWVRATKTNSHRRGEPTLNSAAVCVHFLLPFWQYFWIILLVSSVHLLHLIQNKHRKCNCHLKVCRIFLAITSTFAHLPHLYSVSPRYRLLLSTLCLCECVFMWPHRVLSSEAQMVQASFSNSTI